jgi:hypothetical protein
VAVQEHLLTMVDMILERELQERVFPEVPVVVVQRMHEVHLLVLVRQMVALEEQDRMTQAIVMVVVVLEIQAERIVSPAVPTV